jgi:hypothetical protein
MTLAIIINDNSNISDNLSPVNALKILGQIVPRAVRERIKASSRCLTVYQECLKASTLYVAQASHVAKLELASALLLFKKVLFLLY